MAARVLVQWYLERGKRAIVPKAPRSYAA